VAAAVALTAAVTVSAGALAATGSFVGPLHSFARVASAVPTVGPAKGDINPYGVVVVPRTAGKLVGGDILVSNFDNAANQQGTGSSIVEISPSGHQRVFAMVPADQTAGGHLLLKSSTVIAQGFPEHTDPNALVVGPTGVGLGRGGVLYVADSDANRIAAVPDAMGRVLPVGGGGTTVAKGGPLSDPLGLTIAPDGDIISVNGADGRVMETAPTGRHPAVRNVIPNGGGDLFGVAVAPDHTSLYLVDDAGSGASANSLGLLH
jgi:hypothetical protein